MHFPLNRMTVKFLTIISLVTFVFSVAQAQDQKKVYRPDIPGSLLVDFGFSGTSGAPAKFRTAWFGCRTANVYYYYPMQLGKSKFTFNAGIGLGMDRFKFKNGYFLADTSSLKGQWDLVPNARIDTTIYPKMRKSMLVMNYLDIPLELRFNVNPDDLAHTFWVAVGARGGWLFNSHSKIKYENNGEKIVHKDRQRLGLNQFRYGATLRIGIGNFNFFGFYNLSPLFEKGKGPSQTQMTNFTIGISLIGL
jgi:Outer membrane protein beta-barrel domain